MADLTLKERLQPSLLDRLTDREPGVERESRDRRVINETQLREYVIRDLDWLLNTAQFEASADLSDLPAVQNSVINFGVQDLAGVVVSSMDPRVLEKRLEEAIRRYEPRVIPESLTVRAEMDKNAANQSALSFRIEADLWAQPVPINLDLRTQVDLETGKFSVSDSGT